MFATTNVFLNFKLKYLLCIESTPTEVKIGVDKINSVQLHLVNNDESTHVYYLQRRSTVRPTLSVLKSTHSNDIL